MNYYWPSIFPSIIRHWTDAPFNSIQHHKIPRRVLQNRLVRLLLGLCRIRKEVHLIFDKEKEEEEYSVNMKVTDLQVFRISVYEWISSYAPQGADIIWFRLCQISDHHLRLDWHTPTSTSDVILCSVLVLFSREDLRCRVSWLGTIHLHLPAEGLGRETREYINIIIRQSHANCLSARQECVGNRETAFGYCFPIDLLRKPSSCHPGSLGWVEVPIWRRHRLS